MVRQDVFLRPFTIDMTRYVAFLRAINTPPRHVKMDRLREVFESLGFENVVTFIASGNVIFDADDDTDLVPRIESTLETALGFEVPTFLRTATEVIETVERQPFPEEEGSIEVSFLAAVPDPEAARALEAAGSGSDRLAVIERALYWWHTGPRSNSDHSEARVVRTLGMATTQRSLRTVQRIADNFLR